MMLRVRVIPNARKTEFAGLREGELVLRLTAPAVEGKANRAAVEAVSRSFGISRRNVRLVYGEKSRHKIFQIVGLEQSDLEQRLAELSH